MADKELVDLTIEQTWENFWRNANSNRPGRKPTAEFQACYYAGAHTMLAKTMALFRLRDILNEEWGRFFQIWATEIEKFVEDNNAARDDPAVPAHFPEMLAQLDPETAKETLERLPNEIAYLPSQLRFKKGRVWFPGGIGWVPTEIDPKIVPTHDIYVMFMTKIGGGYTLEARFKSGWKPGMAWPK